jgi:hypothetical protein
MQSDETVAAAAPGGFVALCGRIFRNTDATYFPGVSHRGKMLRLCTSACLRALEADPRGFIRAHGGASRAGGNVDKATLEVSDA